LKKTVWVAEATGSITLKVGAYKPVTSSRTQFFFQKNRVRHPTASWRYGPVIEGAKVFVINPEKPHAVDDLYLQDDNQTIVAWQDEDVITSNFISAIEGSPRRIYLAADKMNIQEEDGQHQPPGRLKLMKTH